MKNCILLILLLGLAGCSINTEVTFKKPDMDRATALCAVNSGLRSVSIGYTYFKTHCNNGASFTTDKERP